MKKRINILSKFLALLFFFVCFCLLHMEEETLLSKRSDPFGKTKLEVDLHRNSEQKVIVLWTPFFGQLGEWEYVFRRHISGECEETSCHVSESDENLDEADAVVFLGFGLKQIKKRIGYPPLKPAPERRNPDQLYIFLTFDPPPVLSNVNLKEYDNFFNWTMTYKLDSDVVIPFGEFRKLKTKRPKSEVKYLNQFELDKKNKAIWIVSHCKTQSKREKLLKKLNKYFPVSSFGKCSNRTCGTKKSMFTNGVGSDPCEKDFDNYVFYMAFENSFCQDYVTEKLYRSLSLGIIPVVHGAVDYSDFAPPNSFIDAKRFKSVKELGKHLQRVSSNATLYNEYLKWKEDYDVEVGYPYKPLICNLCKALHSPRARIKKSYPSIREWFGIPQNCYNFAKFY